MTKPDVFIAKLSRCQYPDEPFHPPEIYSEFKNSGLIPDIDASNQVYSAVREILKTNCSSDDYHFKFFTPAGWKGIYDTYKPA